MRKNLLILMVLVTSLATLAAGFGGSVIYEQDFSEDTGDWSSIVHDATAETGLISDYTFSYFGGTVSDSTYRTTWPEHGYVTELGVYLDPGALDVGDGFDLTVASSDASGEHLRDFIFHIESYGVGDLRVGASNNSRWADPDSPTQGNLDPANSIDAAGWYTLQHVFQEVDGSLAVDLNVLDADGNQLFTARRHNTADVITNVGGARYQWFTFATTTFEIDNQKLIHIEPTPAAPSSKDDCKSGGYEAFGFDNQGQCVASVQANENADR